VLAQVDDRDMATCLTLIQVNGRPATDEQVLAWLHDEAGHLALDLALGWPYQCQLPLQHVNVSRLMEREGFVQRPEANA
jgi:hypothetical protein